MLWDYAPWILGTVQKRQIKAGVHRMSVRSMSRSLGQLVCLFCLFFLKVGLLMLQKKGITVIEWLLFACSRSYQLLTGHIQ